MARIALLLLLTGCVIKSQPKITQSGLGKPRQSIILVCDESCTDAEAERLKLLEAKINQTVNGQCFRDFVLTPNRPWRHLEGRRPQDVLEIMLRPKIVLVRYFTSIYYQLEGFEVAEQAVVNINRLAVTLRGMSLCEEAAVIAHEIAHANGLNHRGNEPDAYNQLSPPYQVNHAFEPRNEDYLNGGCCI